MTTMHRNVVDYFVLMDGDDKKETIRVFAEDAAVIDDGHIYRDRAEILDWLAGAASEYTTTSTELSARNESRSASVVVRLEGNFPGGRVDLKHDFSFDPDGQVQRLEITVSG